MAIFAKQVLLPSGWARDVRIEIASAGPELGRISAIDVAAKADTHDTMVDTLLPALSNLHSHSFQRAMAGLTEYRRAGQDSFWTWRDLMYRFLDRLTPEHIEAIAALAFVEMLEAGFAAVGEFHYVHHQTGGQSYADVAELSARIAAAAHTSGIGLTHLPVLYTYGGAGEQPLSGGQLRFGNDVDRFLELVDGADQAVRGLGPDAKVGIAPHSLRATCPAELAMVLASKPRGPVHIHIAEQTREVAEIEGWLGATPVDWLLNNMPVNERWCLIHATHMTPAETAAMARSGAVAGLCPITEANLGDGMFNGADYLAAGGAFGIGSDSNVRISMTEELRLLEYSQRLRDQARNILVSNGKSVGDSLYTGAASGGAQALGREAGQIEVGRWADLLSINRHHPTLLGLPDERVLDGLVFAARDEVIGDVWSAGRHVVVGGRHVAQEAVRTAYGAAIHDLTDGI